MKEESCQISRRYAPWFVGYLQKNLRGEGADIRPPSVRGLIQKESTDLSSTFDYKYLLSKYYVYEQK